MGHLQRRPTCASLNNYPNGSSNKQERVKSSKEFETRKNRSKQRKLLTTSQIVHHSENGSIAILQNAYSGVRAQPRQQQMQNLKSEQQQRQSGACISPEGLGTWARQPAGNVAFEPCSHSGVGSSRLSLGDSWFWVFWVLGFGNLRSIATPV